MLKIHNLELHNCDIEYHSTTSTFEFCALKVVVSFNHELLFG